MEVRGEQTVSPEHRGLTVEGLPRPLRANALWAPKSGPRTWDSGPHSGLAG